MPTAYDPSDPQSLPDEDAVPDDLRQPWDRVKDPAQVDFDTEGRAESQNAYRAFIDFCMMGRGREIRALHQEYVQMADQRRSDEEKGRDPSIEKPPSTAAQTLYSWSSRYNWRERAEAWQDHKDWEQGVERYEEIEKMQSRHVNMAKLMYNKLIQKLRNLEADRLSVSEVRHYAETAVKIERLAMGVNTESVDHQVSAKPDRPTGETGQDDSQLEDPGFVADVMKELHEHAPSTFDRPTDEDEPSE